MTSLADVFKAYDIRGIVPDQLNADQCRAIGAATARFIGRPRMLLARDMRESGVELSYAFAEGARAEGVAVVDLGMASTDLLYFASGSLDAPGAMFTASHNPAQYNGIKLCMSGARPIGRDSGLAEIEAWAQELLDKWGSAGHPMVDPTSLAPMEEQNLLDEYADHVRSFVDLDVLRPLRVVADTANGMGGLVAPKVFAPLPFQVEILFPELDGNFPNHPADPIQPENLTALQAAIAASGADIGLAFDGDADRCFVVDEKGHPVSPSAVTALVAARELHREIGATVIYNLITSRAVPELVVERGGTPVRSRVGHSYIKALMADTGAIFGGEHSAHYYFRDFWGADSGMLAALHVLAALGEQERPLSDLMADYQRYEASGEINFTVTDAEARVDAVLRSFGTRIHSIDHLDGVTVDLGDGSWLNLRMSNTEPLLRLNVEARSTAEVDEIVGHISQIVQAEIASGSGAAP